MRRVNDVKDYIIATYPLHPNKFEVIKVGSAIWLYVIDKKIQIARYQIFKGSLTTIDSSVILKNYLIGNILDAIIDLGYVPPDYHIDQF